MERLLQDFEKRKEEAGDDAGEVGVEVIDADARWRHNEHISVATLSTLCLSRG